MDRLITATGIDYLEERFRITRGERHKKERAKRKRGERSV